MRKKIAIVVGVLATLFIFSAIFLPRLVDINRYREMIIQKLEGQLNTQVKIGGLRLSLWRGLRIHITGLEVQNPQDFPEKPILSVREGEVSVGLLSVIMMKPRLTLMLDAPSVSIIKDERGNYNLLRLVPQKTQSVETPSSEKKQKEGGFVAGLISKAQFSLLLQNGACTYEDLKVRRVEKLDQLNIHLQNVGLNAPMKFSVRTALDLAQAKKFSLQGQVECSGKIRVMGKVEKIRSAQFETELSLTDLNMKLADTLTKPAGVPFTLESAGKWEGNEVSLGKFQVRLKNFSAQAEGSYLLDKKEARLKLDIPTFDLKDGLFLLKQPEDFEILGKVGLNGEFKGNLTALAEADYTFNFNLEDLFFKAPQFANAVIIPAVDMKMRRGELKLKETEVRFGRSKILFVAEVKNFPAPQIETHLRSSFVDIGEWLPKKEQQDDATEKKPEVTSQTSSSSTGEIPTWLKKLKQPPFNKMKWNGSVKVEQLIYDKLQLQNFIADWNLNNLLFYLSQLQFNLFNGSLQFSAKADFRKSEPDYIMLLKGNSIDLGQIAAQLKPDYKDDVAGRAKIDFNGQSRGVDATALKANATGSGKLEILKGKLSTINLGKAVQEKLQVITIFTGSEIFTKEYAGDFDRCEATVVIQDGKIQTPYAYLDAPNYGARAKGFIDFDKNVSYSGDVLIPGELLNAQELRSVADDRGRVPIPFTVTGTLPNLRVSVNAAKIAEIAVKGTAKKVLEDIIKDKTGVDIPLPF